MDGTPENQRIYLYVTHTNLGKDGSITLLEDLGIQTAVFLFATTRR